MKQHVQTDDRAGPTHGAAGEGDGCVVLAPGIALVAADPVGFGAAAPADLLERPGAVDVQHEHGQQPDPHHPQDQRAGHEVAAEVSQRLGVLVDLGRPLIQVEVADHVHDHEGEQPCAGDRHHILLADGGLVDVQGPGELSSAPPQGRHPLAGPGGSDRLRHEHNLSPTPTHPKLVRLVGLRGRFRRQFRRQRQRPRNWCGLWASAGGFVTNFAAHPNPPEIGATCGPLRAVLSPISPPTQRPRYWCGLWACEGGFVSSFAAHPAPPILVRFVGL